MPTFPVSTCRSTIGALPRLRLDPDLAAIHGLVRPLALMLFADWVSIAEIGVNDDE
jgi:hypothetical protein